MLFVAESAKSKVAELMEGQGLTGDYFVRVEGTSGGALDLATKWILITRLKKMIKSLKIMV